MGVILGGVLGTALRVGLPHAAVLRPDDAPRRGGGPHPVASLPLVGVLAPLLALAVVVSWGWATATLMAARMAAPGRPGGLHLVDAALPVLVVAPLRAAGAIEVAVAAVNGVAVTAALAAAAVAVAAQAAAPPSPAPAPPPPPVPVGGRMTLFLSGA